MSDTHPQPTREQRRKIHDLLKELYDTERGVYRGDESDKSVAQSCGDNFRAGWVMEIRKASFGDSGENEGQKQAVTQAAQMAQQVESASKDINNACAEIARLKEQQSTFRREIADVRTILVELERTFADISKKIVGLDKRVDAAVTIMGEAKSRMRSIQPVMRKS